MPQTSKTCNLETSRALVAIRPKNKKKDWTETDGYLANVSLLDRLPSSSSLHPSDAGLALGYPTFPKPGDGANEDLTQTVCEFAQAAVLPYLTSVSSSFFVCSKPSSSAARRVASVARASALSKSAVTSRSFVSSNPRILFSELAVSDASANSARN
jgi:hypothetical protein